MIRTLEEASSIKSMALSGKYLSATNRDAIVAAAQEVVDGALDKHFVLDIFQFFEKKFVAFSGIGRPKKFFDTLDKIGLDIIGTFTFDDHHPYSSEDLVKLSTYANRHGAELITTSKDRRRINTNINVAIHELPIYIKWKKTGELDKLFDYLEGNSFGTKA